MLLLNWKEGRVGFGVSSNGELEEAWGGYVGCCGCGCKCSEEMKML